MPGDVCDPREVTALILAAGEGRRLGGRPKAFIEFRARTLLARAVASVSPWATRIIIGVREADLARACATIAALPEASRITCIVGGMTRQDSVRRVLAQATTRYVLLHEVARAWSSPENFRNVLLAVQHHPAVVLYSKIICRDSVALLEGSALGEILPRDNVITLQTPHAYERRVLSAAYGGDDKDFSFQEGTAAQVKRAGFPIHLVEGVGSNIKITYPADLPLVPQKDRIAESR